MGILEPVSISDIPLSQLNKLVLDPTQKQGLESRIGDLIKKNFPYLPKMVSDLHKEEKLVTTYTKPIGGSPILSATKDQEKEEGNIRISKGGKSITFTMRTDTGVNEDLGVQIIDHNYDKGYRPNVIMDSISTSLVQLDKFEEDGTVKFERVTNLDHI